MSRPYRFIRIGIIVSTMLIIVPRGAVAGKPAAWIRLRSPNFIVVTDGSEKQARKVAYQFEMIRAVLREFFNSRSSAPDPPVIIIGAKDEASLKPLLPEAYLAKGATHLAGFYVGGPEKNYVALRLDAGLEHESYNAFEPIYHEYVHYFLRRSISRLPLWLTEGLAEFYGNTRLEGKFAMVGAPSDSNLTVLRQTLLLPVDTLYAVNASSPYYHEDNKASIFYAESWALTHYLMVRDWREQTSRLQQFVNLLGQNLTPEDAAKRTIGDTHTLDGALREYLSRFSFTAARLPAPPSVNEASFVPEPISEAESLAVRADFLVHNRRFADAQRMLQQALEENPKLASAYESMGLLYAEQNKVSEANKWYSQSVALNSQSYLAHFYYATNLFKAGMDEATAAQAEGSLRKAIQINAEFAPAYEALAFLLASRHRELEDARVMALHAVSLEPGNLHYRLRMVQIWEELDNPDNAVRVAEIAVSMANSPAEVIETESALNNARQFQQYKQQSQEAMGGFNRPAAQSAKNPEPPVLQHRNEAEGSSAESAPSQPPRRQRPELLVRSEVADGAISQDTCPDGKTLEITLATASGNRQLYSDNFYKIPFTALNFTPKGVLNPCSDLKGLTARVTYHPSKDHPEQGEITDVQVRQ